MRSSALERGRDAFPSETGERRDWVEDSSIFSCGRKKTGDLKVDLIPAQVEKLLWVMGRREEKGAGEGGNWETLGTASMETSDQDSHTPQNSWHSPKFRILSHNPLHKHTHGHKYCSDLMPSLGFRNVVPPSRAE